MRAMDDQGRLASNIDGLGNKTQYNYKNQQLDSIHYPTFEEQLTYDIRDRIISSTQRAGNLEVLRRFGYDRNSNLIDSIDANGNSDTGVYDSLSRLTLRTDADGGETRFQI